MVLPSSLAPRETRMAVPILAVRWAKSEIFSSTGGVSSRGPIFAPKIRSWSSCTCSWGSAFIPCIAATTDEEFAALQSVSAKSAACSANVSV